MERGGYRKNIWSNSDRKFGRFGENNKSTNSSSVKPKHKKHEKTTLRHSIIKLLTTCDKEKISNAARKEKKKKKKFLCIEKTIRKATDIVL